MRRYVLLLFLLTGSVFSLFGQAEIFLSTLDNRLYRLNLNDCSYELVADMPIGTTDISFHPNGNLYGITGNGMLYEIDLANDNAILIHSFQSSSSQLYTSLTISAAGIFYACGLAGDLYNYDLTSDTGNFLGNVGWGAEGDLTFFNGELYMAAEDDNIVLVDIDNPGNSSIAIDGNVPGRIFGVVSYAASCEEVSVYALTNNAASVYEVNFDDNSLDLFCSIPLQVSGGASTFEFLGSNPVFVDDIVVDGFNCGAADGSISVTASGGVGALSYSLDGINYQASGVFTGLGVQEYIVYVADEVGCVRTDTVMAVANVPMFDELRITNTLCGESNGQIEVVVSGGVEPYEFYLNGVLSTTGLSVMNLSDGNYQLEIIDAAGCSATTQANLGGISPPTIVDLGLTSTTCGADNGSIEVELSGGLTPISYSLNGGPSQNTPDFSNLAPGTYTLDIVDFAGCSDAETFEILSSTGVAIEAVSVQDASCGQNNGGLSVEANGDGEPFLFGVAISSLEFSPTISELAADEYEVFVFNRFGCSDTTMTTILDSPPVELSLVSQQAADCQEDNGLLSVSTTGGTGLVRVTLNGALVAKPEDITGLAPGAYLVQALDELGCSDTLSTVIAAANCPVYVPNVFSPNRDGVNDFFFPQAAADAGIEIVRFQIFDRWGGALFEQGTGPIGDVRFRWDGRRAGEPLPQGVYVYFLELRYAEGETLQLSGDVTLLR